jgi:hypothetical protein
MRPVLIGDIPFVAAIDPNIERVRANDLDHPFDDFPLQHALLDHVQVFVHEHAAVEGGDRGAQLERLDQHLHAAGRTPAGDRKGDAGGAETPDGVERARSENLVVCDQRAIHVSQDQANVVHIGSVESIDVGSADRTGMADNRRAQI